MKHIVICSDGTGNTAIKGRGTNVFKLFEAVDVIGHKEDSNKILQIAFYDDGVGTEKFLPLKILGGAAGWGLSRNVKELYTALVRVYEPGDKLFLFGFSRGAFTVRTLAGMIANCGIVDVARKEFGTEAALDRAIKKVYREYRKRYQTTLSRWIWGKKDPEKCLCIYSHQVSHPLDNIKIECLGVWDTVDAVGLPFHLADVINEVLWRFKFPDRSLNAKVQHAYHALALDEERHSFRPVLWDEQNEPPDRIEQVWFAGVHSNIGGGYPRQGMSLVALDWMMQKAENHGLRLLPEVRALYRALQNVDDKLYNPRAGLGVFYRWKPRDLRQLRSENQKTSLKLHLSAIERIAHSTEGYAPGNILPGCAIVDTSSGDNALTKAKWAQVQSVLQESHATREGRANLPLLDDVRCYLNVGFASYYLFLAGFVGLLAVIGVYIAGYLSSGESLPTPAHFAAIIVMIGIIIVAGWLAKVTNAGLSKVCSEFWHKAQQHLKKVLYDKLGM